MGHLTVLDLVMLQDVPQHKRMYFWTSILLSWNSPCRHGHTLVTRTVPTDYSPNYSFVNANRISPPQFLAKRATSQHLTSKWYMEGSNFPELSPVLTGAPLDVRHGDNNGYVGWPVFPGALGTRKACLCFLRFGQRAADR
jgi:hypothetical protein